MLCLMNVDGPEGTYLSTHGEWVAVDKDHVSWDLEMGNLHQIRNITQYLSYDFRGADDAGPSEPDV